MGALISFDNLGMVMQEYAELLERDYQEELREDGHYATGNLINNMHYIIESGGTSIEVSLSLADYYKYLEKGTRPHWPPIDAIMQWIKVKRILPSKTYDGKLPTEKQLAYLIARKISEVGTKGSDDLKKSIQDVNSVYEMKIIEAINKDLDAGLTAILMELNV